MVVIILFNLSRIFFPIIMSYLHVWILNYQCQYHLSHKSIINSHPFFWTHIEIPHISLLIIMIRAYASSLVLFLFTYVFLLNYFFIGRTMWLILMWRDSKIKLKGSDLTDETFWLGAMSFHWPLCDLKQIITSLLASTSLHKKMNNKKVNE